MAIGSFNINILGDTRVQVPKSFHNASYESVCSDRHFLFTQNSKVMQTDKRRIFTKKGEEILIDPQFYDDLIKVSWCVHNGYAYNRARGYMHKVILNPPYGLFTDHINRDKIDNRLINLRPATRSENAKNRKASGKVPYLGVSENIINKKYTSKKTGEVKYYYRKKYIAHINNGEKQIHIGVFDNPISAALAYNVEAIKYHGEFARINRIVTDYPFEREVKNG